MYASVVALSLQSKWGEGQEVQSHLIFGGAQSITMALLARAHNAVSAAYQGG